MIIYDIMKLDVGCGYAKKEGFIGMDSDKNCKPDILWNMTKFPYPIKSERVKVLHSQHALENSLTSKDTVSKILKEWYRISCPNSIWIITLPHWTRFPSLEHLIGFEYKWWQVFSTHYTGTTDHHLDMDIKFSSMKYNWRRTDYLHGFGNLLKVIRAIWNPILNLNDSLTEELLCYKLGGITEWTFVLKIK